MGNKTQYNELTKHYSDKTDQYRWIHDHKDMFKNPDNQESLIISQIFQSPKMRENIHQKNILENRPSADPYIVAKAKVLEVTVVRLKSTNHIRHNCLIFAKSWMSFIFLMKILWR